MTRSVEIKLFDQSERYFVLIELFIVNLGVRVATRVVSK